MRLRTLALPATLAACATQALAHGGHGMPGQAHWHATDTLGLLLVAVLGGAAWWFSQRK